MSNDTTPFASPLAKGDWQESYDGRTRAFKAIVSKELYLATMASNQRMVRPLQYRVLAHDEFVTGKETRKRLIVKFVVGSSQPEYSVVWWKFQDGHWRCEEAGLRRVPLLMRMGDPEE